MGRRQRNTRSSRLWIVAAILLLGAASCGSSEEAIDPALSEQSDKAPGPTAAELDDVSSAPTSIAIDESMTLAEQLAAAKANWAANGSDTYDLTVEMNCCPITTVRSTVLDGRLMASEVLAGQPGGWAPATVEDLFEEVEIYLRNDIPSDGVAVFDPATGALTSWTMPFDETNETDDRILTASYGAATPIELADHGAEIATAACPDTSFALSRGSEFSVQLPVDLVQQEVEGVDSEVAYFGDDEFEVSWDFGWYSNDLSYWAGPFTSRTVNYSGIGGRIVTAEAVPGSYEGRQVTAAHFGRVSGSPGEWNSLTLYIQYRDPSQQALAECIVSSIDW